MATSLPSTVPPITMFVVISISSTHNFNHLFNVEPKSSVLSVSDIKDVLIATTPRLLNVVFAPAAASNKLVSVPALSRKNSLVSDESSLVYSLPKLAAGLAGRDISPRSIKFVNTGRRPGASFISESTSADHMLMSSEEANSGIGNGTGEFGLSGSIEIQGLNEDMPVQVQGKTTWMGGGAVPGDLITAEVSGVSGDDANGGATTQVDAIQFIMSTGGITSGKIYLYVQIIA